MYRFIKDPRNIHHYRIFILKGDIGLWEAFKRRRFILFATTGIDKLASGNLSKERLEEMCEHRRRELMCPLPITAIRSGDGVFIQPTFSDKQ